MHDDLPASGFWVCASCRMSICQYAWGRLAFCSPGGLHFLSLPGTGDQGTKAGTGVGNHCPDLRNSALPGCTLLHTLCHVDGADAFCLVLFLLKRLKGCWFTLANQFLHGRF